MSCAPLRPPRPPTAASLAPGFRFHPTDEELVGHYLKRKVLGRSFRVDAISEIDVYKSDPWDLPGKFQIQSRDREGYFFSGLDKKYAHRSRTNRATGSGYWKPTGKDRAVSRCGRTVGMKKTLVFHIGRAPKGERTHWVMHEYRLDDEELARAGIPQDAFVVCRIFQMSDPGPQNGAQYGAPFVDEEWKDDDIPVINEEGALIVVNNSVTEMVGDERDAVTNVKQQCSDFVMTRNIQCRAMIEDVQRQIAGLNFSSDGKAGYNYPPVGQPHPPGNIPQQAKCQSSTHPLHSQAPYRPPPEQPSPAFPQPYPPYTAQRVPPYHPPPPMGSHYQHAQ